MPELPEVETTRLGVSPHVAGQIIQKVIIRNGSLRWPVPIDLEARLIGQTIEKVDRRAKYLLFRMASGILMIHLGMSGSLRIVPSSEIPRKHDHIDLVFGSHQALRYHDPRRFGSVHWVENTKEHPLLSFLGPEPLTEEFSGLHLFLKSRSRSVSVKQFVMDGRVVVGVGNIYASEALFLSGIRPSVVSRRISFKRYEKLAISIKHVLSYAIKHGGTTLRDFVSAEGTPGYFSQELNVYGREGEKCNQCGNLIRSKILGQRTSFFCSVCQR